MPRFNTQSSAKSMAIPGPGNFQFSAVRPEEIAATEQTLVVVAMDVSSSLASEARELDRMLSTIVEACRQSPRADNILLRVVTFASDLKELHGFKPVTEIDPNGYAPLQPNGMTALYDAAYSAIGSTLTFGQTLINHDLDVNGIVFVVTDGMDNRSKSSPGRIRKLLDQAMHDEMIDSVISVLIGIGGNSSYLDQFKNQAQLSEMINAGQVSVSVLAKLGRFISQSIVSQSQSLSTGTVAPSLTF